jgi:hypothetical protein
MISTKAMHPPAVSSALIFAFQPTRINTVMLFFFAVLLLAILIVLQRVSLWLIKRSEKRNRNTLNDDIKILRPDAMKGEHSSE